MNVQEIPSDDEVAREEFEIDQQKLKLHQSDVKGGHSHCEQNVYTELDVEIDELHFEEKKSSASCKVADI